MPTKKSAKPPKKSKEEEKQLPVRKSEKPSPEEKKRTPKKKSVTNRLFRKIKEKTATATAGFSPIINTSASEIDSIRGESSKGKPPSKKKPEKKAPKKTAAKEGTIVDALFDEKDILPLLKLPFAVSGEITGYKYEMPKDYGPILQKTGAQIIKDFGIEAVSKWVHLGIFAAIYGSCVFTWLKGTRLHMEMQALEMQKTAHKASQEPTPKDEKIIPMIPPAVPPSEKVVTVRQFESSMDEAAAAVKDAR